MFRTLVFLSLLQDSNTLIFWEAESWKIGGISMKYNSSEGCFIFPKFLTKLFNKAYKYKRFDHENFKILKSEGKTCVSLASYFMEFV